MQHTMWELELLTTVREILFIMFLNLCSMARKFLNELLKKMDNDELEVLKGVTEKDIERALQARTWEVRNKYKIGECFINFDKALNCAWLYKVIDYQGLDICCEEMFIHKTNILLHQEQCSVYDISRMDKMDEDLYKEIRQCVKDYIDTVSQWESDTFSGVMNILIEHECF